LSRKIIGKELNGRKIVGVRRRAKLLIIDLNNNSSLVFHLKMTGQLIFNGKTLPSTRKVFYFKDGSRLIFNDARKFGWWKIVKSTRTMEEKLGPEALEISLLTFKNTLRKRPASRIKLLLIDQRFIAGIGNIYSDEILYAAKVHPLRRVKTLNYEEIKRIFYNIGRILRLAIKCRGSSVEHYIDACGKKGSFIEYHKAYQKEGQKCRRCSSLIKRIKISGRSARFCPSCQSL